MNDNMLAEVLYKSLKRQRFLVVLDGIRPREAWDDVIKSFPSDNFGSKILVTSKLKDLNIKRPHLLNPRRLLTENRSRGRRAKKVFRSWIFPVDLISRSSLSAEDEIINDQSEFFTDNLNRCDLIAVGLNEEEIVVGLEEETQSLLDQLTGTTHQLELISIVGMLGLVYNQRDTLIGILTSFTDVTDDEYHEMNDNMLAEVLYKCLKRQRFLVVLDDIWSHEAWDDVKKSFPNDNFGSKILVTSRLQDFNFKMPHLLHHRRLLTENESHVLLAKKVFCSGRFPVELIGIGREIAKRCRGLPLAIVVISGLLRSKGANSSWWSHVAESVNSYIVDDQLYNCMDTLALSYYHLPQHIRPLFLYFGVFPEDFEIPVRKLIWLWVSEGLIIQKSGSKSLEKIANDYLTDLLKRSLVVASSTRSDGGTKTCRIHDLLRDLCLQKSEEEKFSPRIYRYLEKGTIPWVTLEDLRVLDLGTVTVLLFPCEVLQLAHLRYLAIHAENGSPPASLSNLLNLQILIISSRRNVTIPRSTWKQLNLRHILIKSGENIMEDPCSEDKLSLLRHEGSPSLLDNLQTLSQVYPSPFCMAILERATNLRKLGLCGPLISNLGDLMLPSLGCLNRLETLKLLNTNSFPETAKLGNPIMFPERLKRLTLSNTFLSWMEMWILGMLPNLEVLKLKFHSCIDDKWETSDGGFQRLKFLKFQDLDIVHWEASSEHFQSLQRLVVQRCSNLLGIPSSLGNICTLELIEVRWCSDSAAQSAWDIHNEQKSQGNDFLKVLVTLKAFEDYKIWLDI